MKVAFINFRHGHVFSLYREAQKNENIDIVGCFEDNVQARETAERELGASFCYGSLEELLLDKSVEAVAVGSVYGMRGRTVIKALEHGKHIVSDKPLCTDFAELERISNLAVKNGLCVVCMFELRFMPQALSAKRLIQQGAIGRVRSILFDAQHCLNYGSRPSWYFEDGMHGGTINDIACHGIDLVRFLTEKELSKIDYARCWNAFAYKHPNFCDSAQFAVRMDDITVSADLSYSAPPCRVTLPTYWNFRIFGDKGMLCFNLADPQLYLYKENKETIICSNESKGFFDELIKEIETGSSLFGTRSIIQSQRTVLQIQQFADQRQI